MFFALCESVKRILSRVFGPVQTLEFGPEMAKPAATLGRYEARATEGIRRLKQQKKITLTDVADVAGIPQSSMSRIYDGKQPVTLRILEAIEQITGESAMELLVDPSTELKALNPAEMQLLRFFRSWPKATREALITFASFFADEPPATHDLRRAHEQLRRLSESKLRGVFAYLTFLTEGDLPPDLRAALGLPETDVTQSTTTKRRTDKT